MIINWWAYLIWIPAASLLGFLITYIFAGILRWQRSIFLIPYVVLTTLFVYTYARWSNLNLTGMINNNWGWGIIGAIIASLLLVRAVLRQPVSPRSQGKALILKLIWLGLIYGAVDSILLSVLPVWITWQAFSSFDFAATLIGKIAIGVLAFILSEVVTVAYHWGYPEFRSKSVKQPVIGNGICTLAYLLSMNPLAAIGSHVVMHIAAVWHGPKQTVQLPPHYPSAAGIKGSLQQTGQFQ